MRQIRPAKAALSVGIVIGLYHLAWIALVASGLAKPFLDFVLRLHKRIARIVEGERTD